MSSIDLSPLIRHNTKKLGENARPVLTISSAGNPILLNNIYDKDQFWLDFGDTYVFCVEEKVNKQIWPVHGNPIQGFESRRQAERVEENKHFWKTLNDLHQLVLPFTSTREHNSASFPEMYKVTKRNKKKTGKYRVFAFSIIDRSIYPQDITRWMYKYTTGRYIREFDQFGNNGLDYRAMGIEPAGTYYIFESEEDAALFKLYSNFPMKAFYFDGCMEG